MEYALFSAFTALIVALILTPVIRKFAVKFGIVAATNHRTIHSSQIPKLGGLSIFIAFTIGAFFYAKGTQNFDLFWGLWFGGFVVVGLGFLDDIFTLSCYRKLFFQTIAALIAVYFGFKIESAILPFSTLPLGYFSVPLSLLWIVGVTNAINLLDGLDGLASGISILLGLLIIIISGFTNNLVLAALTLVLITSTLGFLRYNFPPAKIFMGDTGSLFLGFCLACLSIKAFTFDTMGTHLGALFVPFSLPITDTLLAIIRRTSEGNHPFSADKKHIHHRLLDLGFNQYSAVFIIYATTIVFAAVGMIIIFIEMHYAVLFLAAIFAIFIVGLFQLDCFDFIGKGHSYKIQKQMGLNRK